MRFRFFVIRLFALAQKELLHILRDRQVIYLALGMPLMMVLLFGYAVTFDVDHVKIAVLDHDRSPASRFLIEKLRASNAFVIYTVIERAAEAETLFRRDEVKGALIIPPDFARRLAGNKNADFQLLLDGSDGTSTRIALGYANEISQRQTIALFQQASFHVSQLLQPRLRTWYNTNMLSALFVVPGLVAVVVGILAILLSSLTIAREWERGTMEQLFTTPVARLPVVLGKLFPYVALGILQLLLVLVAGAWLFQVPLRGSFLLLFSASFLFLVCVLGQGLLISMIARNQQVATQVAAVSGMLPALLLSGFLFPLENMPKILQLISYLVPARYMIPCLRGILLQGWGATQLWPQFLGMAILATSIITGATLRFRRRLD